MAEDAEMDRDVCYGSATLSPDEPIAAGQTGTWQLRYRVGRYGIDNGGRIKLAFRLASDWAVPQFDDPQGADYFTVSTTGRGKVTPTFSAKGHYRPWFRTVTVWVSEYPLQEGDEVIMTLGDTSGGGPGTRAQTFRESEFEFRLLIEPFESGVFARVPSSPRVPVVGGDVDRLLAIAPSEVQVREPFSLTVKAEDEWGNPSHSYAGTVHFTSAAEGLPDSYTFSPQDNGVHRFDGVTLPEDGVCELQVEDRENGMRAVSNPVRVTAEGDRAERRRFWADLHGQTGSTVGTGSVEEYFRFARDVAAVDVCTHQGNDFQITADDWGEICEETRRFCAPGEFITFLGYEWSGNTPAGGDHNVIWYRDDRPIYRSSHWQVPDRSDADTDCYPVSELYDALRDEDALIIPHIGGRRAVLDYHRTEQAPLIEICSVHGRFEWFLHEAIERGLHVGVVANGDDHTGRPGAAYATDRSFGVRGGLTCILAEELTRASVWEALRARRTYATTGERMYLSFAADGHGMGEEYRTAEAPEFVADVIGTAPLHSVQIMNGDRVAYEHPVVDSGDLDPAVLRVAWSGAHSTSRGREANWNGGLHIEGGEFLSAREFAFDHPGQRLVESGREQLRWTSTTSGDVDGLLVSVRADDDAVVTFTSAPCSFSFSLGDVRGGGQIVQRAGGVEQAVQVSLAPRESGPRRVQFAASDPEPHSGVNAYYLRVMQEDGEMAWSSPVYVDLAGD